MPAKRQTLTIEAQRYHMKRLWPQFACETNRGNWARWTGTLQPSPLSNAYTVEISYTEPSRPKVKVLDPELELHPGSQRLPHFYPDGTLCLHLAHEWRRHLVIAETIVPWTSTWLYFYEAWAATGYWSGEGTHPSFPEHRSFSRRGDF